jgi:hypothetical protein
MKASRKLGIISPAHVGGTPSASQEALDELAKRFNAKVAPLQTEKTIKWDELIELARTGDYLPLCKVLEDMGKPGKALSKLVSDAIAGRLTRPPNRARKSRLTRIYEDLGVHIVLRELKEEERRLGKSLRGKQRTIKIEDYIDRLPTDLRDKTTLKGIKRVLKNSSR